MERGGPIVETRELRVEGRGEPILEGVTFRVARGERVGICGPNGGGKSTLLKALLGLVPSAGDIRLFGEPLARASRRDRLAYLPQDAAFVDPDFPATAEEVVRLGLRPRGLATRLAPGWGRAAARRALAHVEAEHLAARRVGRLSGGERQRVHLAMVLAAGPELLLLDEPTTGLDPERRRHLLDLLDRLVAESGVTLLLVSHEDEVLHGRVDRLLHVDRRAHAKPVPSARAAPKGAVA